MTEEPTDRELMVELEKLISSLDSARHAIVDLEHVRDLTIQRIHRIRCTQYQRQKLGVTIA